MQGESQSYIEHPLKACKTIGCGRLPVVVEKIIFYVLLECWWQEQLLAAVLVNERLFTEQWRVDCVSRLNGKIHCS